MKQIFISDLHLDESRPDLTAAFFEFLENHCQNVDELYILGDFFDVWLGDDDITPFNTRITDALAALPPTVFIMHGNRDFLMGEQMCRAANATLLPEETIINTLAGDALLLHGDSLCTLDTEYMKARIQLRSRAFQTSFLSKSLEERSDFARKLRGESKAHTRETAADIMDVTPSEVIEVMQAAGVRLMIHGHTHRPDVHDINLTDGVAAQRYVLGDWDTSMQYLEISHEQPALKHYRF